MRARKPRTTLRGGALLVYLVAVLPAQLFGLALIVDIGRVITVHNSMGAVADSISMAAASAFTSDGSLSTSEGQSRALATFDRAKDTSMVPMRQLSEVTKPEVVYTPAGNPDTVTIKIDFTLDGLLLVRFFNPGGTPPLVQGTVVRSARVCNASDETAVCPYPV